MIRLLYRLVWLRVLDQNLIILIDASIVLVLLIELHL